MNTENAEGRPDDVMGTCNLYYDQQTKQEVYLTLKGVGGEARGCCRDTNGYDACGHVLKVSRGGGGAGGAT